VKAPLDLVSLIKRASLDTHLRNDAIINWRCNAKNIFEHQERTGVRISDAGKCALELWAELHGKNDIPEDPDLQISRFDIGTLYGLWLACLTKAVIEAEHPDWDCDLEPEVALDGVQGHIDVLVRLRSNLTPLWVIEFKSTYWGNALEAPHERAFYQVLQAASYAEAKRAPVFSIVTIGPAVHGKYDKQVKKWVTPSKMRQDDYQTSEYAHHAKTEIKRLKTALAATPAEADAEEDWRCKSCRYSGCNYNKNPRNLEAAS